MKNPTRTLPSCKKYCLKYGPCDSIKDVGFKYETKILPDWLDAVEVLYDGVLYDVGEQVYAVEQGQVDVDVPLHPVPDHTQLQRTGNYALSRFEKKIGENCPFIID